MSTEHMAMAEALQERKKRMEDAADEIDRLIDGLWMDDKNLARMLHEVAEGLRR